MPGVQVEKMLRRVQSMTKRSVQAEMSAGAMEDPAKDLTLKSGSKKFGSGRKTGVFGAFKSSSTIPKTRSLTRLGSLPGDIPQGCLAVYVGPERRRFVISTKYLSHPLFKSLLKKCEEEFGFQYKGGLSIACDPVLFEHMLWLIGTNNPAAKTTQLEHLLDCQAPKQTFLSGAEANLRPAKPNNGFQIYRWGSLT